MSAEIKNPIEIFDKDGATKLAELWVGHAQAVLDEQPAKKYQTTITSPPYYAARFYNGGAHEIGHEPFIEDYIEKLVKVFKSVRRALRDDGTLWVVIGDIYASGADEIAPIVQSREVKFNRKDLCGIPWRLAFALQKDGWVLRNEVIWEKTSILPTSAKDRCSVSHEQIFYFSKNEKYLHDKSAILEPLAVEPHAPGNKRTGRKGANRRNAGILDPNRVWGSEEGRNCRTVWRVSSVNNYVGHPAPYPPDLIDRCVRASSRVGDMVLDPFCGSGTTGMVALEHKRTFCGIDTSAEYQALAERRIQDKLATISKNLF